jgi:hypothetical protein
MSTRGAMMRELRAIANEAVAKKQNDANILASKNAEIMALYAEHIPKIKEGMRAAAANGEFRFYYLIDGWRQSYSALNFDRRVYEMINVWFMQEPEWTTQFDVKITSTSAYPADKDYIKFEW